MHARTSCTLAPPITTILPISSANPEREPQDGERTMSDYGTHRIVVGFDGSPNSLAALDWAIAEARLRELAVVAYHVGQHSDDPTSAGDQVLDQAMTRGAMRGDDVKLTCELVQGDPVRRLAKTSADADLLVIGARGPDGAGGPGAGSVGGHIVGEARCPVVVTRDGIDRDDRIVVGVDGSPGADIAVRFAFAEAARRTAPLHAVHASDAPDAPQRLHGWLGARAASYPNVPVTEHVVLGGAGSALLDAAAGAALLVLGSRGHGDTATADLGSTSETVLRQAACPSVFVR